MGFIQDWRSLGAVVSRQGRLLGLGIGATLALGSSAVAAPEIVLVDRQAQVTLNLVDLQQFAETGVVPPQMQAFFQTSGRVPQNLSSLLTREVLINPRFINNFLSSTTGEFLLLKLNETIASSAARPNLEGLKTAVVTAHSNDNRVSILEILRHFPADSVTINVVPLEGAYNDVKTFVERILPALEIAKDFLRDIVCECEQVTTPGSTSTGKELNLQNCKLVDRQKTSTPIESLSSY
ncbi:MAG: alpha/beta hydrolase [Chloroflexaceae bacterium]|nr:alpha/beta hydrolase [Chloroflexaceae bacterium]